MPLTETHSDVPAWIVCAWPPILWQASRAPQLHLAHRGTRIVAAREADRPACGQTIWTHETESRSVGLAWDWVEIRDGVVAMADPFGVATNLRLVDDGGQVLDDVAAAIRLQRVLHALPWQNAVGAALHHG